MDHEEPSLQTDDDVQEVLEELKAREPIFSRPSGGADRETFEQMTDPDFWEVGASGRRYSRDFVLDNVVERHAGEYYEEDYEWETRDFHCRRLAGECYLLTYTLIDHDSRVTRRSTIWRRTDDDWAIVYHQGTLVEDE